MPLSAVGSCSSFWWRAPASSAWFHGAAQGRSRQKAILTGIFMDLKLPNLGEGADSGTVVNIFVKEGDQIAKDQPVLELENEKAVATIPASGSGTVTKIYVKTGDKVSVGQR